MSSLGDSCLAQLLWQPSLYVYMYLPHYSPEWHSLYLPSDVATLQSGRHCGTYPPSDLMPSPSRASCSQSYPNVRPTVADVHVAVPSCAPDPATHDSMRRYPVRLADDCVRPLDGWAIVPADSLVQDRCSGSASTTGTTETARERDRGRDKMSQSVRDVIKKGCKCGWGWIERG